METPRRKKTKCERCMLEFCQAVLGCLCVVLILFVGIFFIVTLVYCMAYYREFLIYFFENIKHEIMPNSTSFAPNVNATTTTQVWRRIT